MTLGLAAIAATFGGLIAAANWYALFVSLNGSRHVSPVPLIGGLLLVLGLLGFEQTRSYAWLGILADPGTIRFLLAVPPMMWEAWTTSSPNLLHRFVSEADGRRDDIQLFKRAKFTITTEYAPPVPANEHGGLAVSRGRVGRWRPEADGFVLEGYGENRILKIKRHESGFKTEEENYPDDCKYPVDRLGMLQLKKII